MKITVNKKKLEIESNINLIKLIEILKLVPDKTLVSINEKVIAQSDFEEMTLKENDEIELFSFVGGG